MIHAPYLHWWKESGMLVCLEKRWFYETGVYPSAKAMVLPLSPLRDPVSLLFC
jgi:hypothetical protein